MAGKKKKHNIEVIVLFGSASGSRVGLSRQAPGFFRVVVTIEAFDNLGRVALRLASFRGGRASERGFGGALLREVSVKGFT